MMSSGVEAVRFSGSLGARRSSDVAQPIAFDLVAAG